MSVARILRRLRRNAVAGLAVALWLLGACGSTGPTGGEPTPTPIPVYLYENPSAFDIQYPTAWTEVVLSQGVMVFAPTEVLNLEAPGPSLTVYRVPPGLSEDDLEGELDRFLGGRPELQGAVGEAQPRAVDGKPGLAVDLTPIGEAEGENLHGYLAVVRTDSDAVYYFIATAPAASWDSHWPSFQVMLESVRFHE